MIDDREPDLEETTNPVKRASKEMDDIIDIELEKNFRRRFEHKSLKHKESE